ncbi:MAG: ABC transporter substrate-binding protein [Aquabacterium sp.]|jgi:ABC-type nitrate/sulfonate/bicarbonate transport system substrate-binding protein|uniref:ABC transporter substrate-binding protein n=1 Tax=Aquabacterium sp. TaxID=1872578 RepID=UPI003BAE73D1
MRMNTLLQRTLRDAGPVLLVTLVVLTLWYALAVWLNAPGVIEHELKPGCPDISPVQVIAGKSADVIVNWMPDALVAREAGVPLVNIAQVFDKSGLMLTCKKASGVATPKDFKGKTLGVWYGGNEYPS